MSLSNQEDFYVDWRRAMDNAVFIGCGVDWNRATIDSELLPWKRDGIDILRAVRLLAGDSAVGGRAKSFSNSGYSGLALGCATLGYRGDSAWVELRSAGADKLWAYDWYDMAHCTRIDLSLDMLVPFEFYRLGETIMKGFEWFIANHKRNGKWKIPDYRRKQEGETVYIGSRNSDHFFRIYNKTVESGWNHPEGNIWRIEIQFQNPIANEVSHGLRRVGITQRKLFGQIRHYCESAGILTCDASGYRPLVGFRVDPIPTDNERSLTWLNRSVKGTVARLTKAGEYDKVERALGLYGLDTRSESEVL